MSVYYTLGCQECKKEIFAVSSNHCGTQPGNYTELLDFIVDHVGHKLVVYTENYYMDKKTGKIKIRSKNE